MVNNENDKKDHENLEIQEITISGDNLENKPKDENEEPNKDDIYEIIDVKVDIKDIEDKDNT